MTDISSRLHEAIRHFGILNSCHSNPASAQVSLLQRVLQSHHAISMADQAIVSGTSFLTIIALARWANPRELGAYVIAATLVVSASAFQDSLILQPYTVHCASTAETRASRVGASFTIAMAFAILISATIMLASMLLKRIAVEPEVATATFEAGAITPFVLARDFARRSSFAHMLFPRAMLLDACVAITQVIWLMWLWASIRMSAANVWAGIGLANAICVAGWLYVVRNELLEPASFLRSSLSQIWSLGKWLLLGRVAVQIQSFVVFWIVFAVSGPAATGVYAACSGVVNLANPLVLAIGNVMMPKMVLSWRAESGTGLLREAVRNALLMSLPIIGFGIFLWCGGAQLMHLLYRSTQYEGHVDIVLVLALALLAASVGSPASFGLAAMERPRAVVAAATFGAIATVVAVWAFTSEWGLPGAACGLLIGSTCGACVRWGLLYWLLPRQVSVDGLSKVVETLLESREPRPWRASRVGCGEQADVFIVKFDGPPDPGNAIAIKLYKEGKVTAAQVKGQFLATSALHDSLNDWRFGDWQILVPRPLSICPFPLALIMTVVPGQHLDQYASGELRAIRRDSVEEGAHALARAMQRHWLRERRHADLGIRNVLLDLENRKIALIDAGTRDSCPVCNDSITFPSHSVADVAHVLRDAVRDITDILGQPKARLIKELFAETVIRTIFESLPAAGERQERADQVMRCLRAHLNECLDSSWSPKGITHRLVGVIALNRARAILSRVIAQCEITPPEAASMNSGLLR